MMLAARLMLTSSFYFDKYETDDRVCYSISMYGSHANSFLRTRSVRNL